MRNRYLKMLFVLANVSHLARLNFTEFYKHLTYRAISERVEFFHEYIL